MAEANGEQKSYYAGIDFNGLFYDALSGEFVAPQDALRRTHTLGRLAYATVLRSIPTISESEPNTFLHQHEYEPTWANGVIVTASGIALNNKLKVDTVFLNFDETGDELIITAQKEGVVSIGNHIPNDTMPGLGDHELSLDTVSSARIAVSTAAQTFFDRNHRV